MLSNEDIDFIVTAYERNQLIDGIKTLRYATHIGLKEAKEFIQLHGSRGTLRDMLSKEFGSIDPHDRLRVIMVQIGVLTAEAKDLLVQIASADATNIDPFYGDPELAQVAAWKQWQDGPHSRACGMHCQGHGPACHPNCPTCHGKPFVDVQF